jgi:hypothetical protein
LFIPGKEVKGLISRVVLRKAVSSFCFLLFSYTLYAQSMSVESFRMLENDLTANTTGTTELDQNGEKAALIKLITTETGFAFDGGMLGIVKSVQKVSEIWVYVPHSIQKIKIMHQELGQIEYYFPIPIEQARTYELVLKATRPEQNVLSTSLVDVTFENAMPESDIYLNGIKIGTGSWNGSILATAYLMEVKQDNYKTYSTRITLNPDDNGRVIRIPALELISGTISVTSQPAGATVFIDGVEVGTTPFNKSGMDLGIHELRLTMPNHRPYAMNIDIKENELNVFNANLTEALMVIVNTQPSGATFSVNGQYKGTTPYTGEFRTGDYNIEFTKNGYRPYSETVHVDASHTRISVPLELIPASESTTRLIKFRSSARSGGKLSNDATYLGAAYGMGYLTSINAYMGAYLGNLNMEIGYMLPQNTLKTDPSDSPTGYTYNLDGIVPLHLGYGLRLGNLMRITPRVGASLNRLKGTLHNIEQVCYVVTGTVDTRFVFSPLRHISLVCTPGYNIPIYKDSHAAELESSEVFRNWFSGFSVNVGMDFFF